MQHNTQLKTFVRPRRARVLAAAALLSGLLGAGCGGSASNQTASTPVGRTTSASTVAAGATSTATSSTPAGGGATDSPGLAFARCMRANGVPNFPDPSPGRGPLFQTSNGVDPASPAFKAAQAKCMKLLGPGPPGPGSTTHPSAQTLAKLRRIAVCMRQHGVPQFPDPRASVPAHPLQDGIDEITDFDGAILLFPGTIDMQAPAYRQALAACGAPPLGLPH
jgi:hypothetical protein